MSTTGDIIQHWVTDLSAHGRYWGIVCYIEREVGNGHEESTLPDFQVNDAIVQR